MTDPRFAKYESGIAAILDRIATRDLTSVAAIERELLAVVGRVRDIERAAICGEDGRANPETVSRIRQRFAAVGRA